MSENTKHVTTTTPSQIWPRGKKIRAPAATPSVPTRVTTSGLTPSLSSRWAIGAITLVQNCRNLLSMASRS
jgi:hypothetical protein